MQYLLNTWHLLIYNKEEKLFASCSFISIVLIKDYNKKDA